MAYDDSTVGVAENNLGTHVDELVDEEQAALEHLLMEQHGTAGLGGHNDQHRQQVGRQARPRGVSERHDGAVDERVDDVVLLVRYIEVVAVDLNLNTEAAEGIGDDAEVVDRDVLDADAVAAHGSHADERADLNHVGQQTVVGAVQLGDTLDGQQV